MLKKVAAEMGVNTGTNSSLWRDRAVVEVNVAVLHSFQVLWLSVVVCFCLSVPSSDWMQILKSIQDDSE